MSTSFNICRRQLGVYASSAEQVKLLLLVSIQSSDGSGPKKTSLGRAQALNVGLGPGPSMSPSLKAGRAGRAHRAQHLTNLS